jgi:hypothetical protein
MSKVQAAAFCTGFAAALGGLVWFSMSRAEREDVKNWVRGKWHQARNKKQAETVTVVL